MIKDLGRVVGKSAYEIACDNGFEGTEQEWVDSMNYDDTELRELINGKSDINHTHDELNTLQEQINSKADIGHTHNEFDNLQNQIDNKVDKVSGKDLSTNDYTTAEKNKLAGLNNYDDSEVKELISGKSDSNHTHDEFNILQTQIDSKADADHTHDNLDGLQETIESAINDALSEIIANAPEDLNTLKEIADWIDTHEDSASAMNTAIQENKTLINNKADKNHTHNEFVKTAQLTKSDGTTNTFYYLIAKSLSASVTSNCDTIFIDGSDYSNRMFEGVIRTRGGNTVYNYGKNDLPLEFYSQTDGNINIYWKVSDAYNKIALSISSTPNMTIYSGVINNTTPTGTKMTFSAYDYKAVANMNIKNFGSPSNTTRYVELSSAENFAGVEVNIAYAGKWYFSIPGSAPLYLGSGGKTYSDYGFQGYAWGTDNKKLYLRFTGYRGVSVSVLGANTNIVSISDWTTTAPTLPSGVSWKNDEYDIKANIDGKANITHTHGTNLSLGSYYYYSADVGTRFYWFKIIDGTVFNASNKHIRLQFNLASDNNYYYKSEYVLDVSYYATSATKNLSVALTNIYANSTKADSNIAIAVDENYNVYAQFNCIWESYVNITKLLGNIDFITTKGSYAAFDTVAGFTSKAKITRNGCCKLTKNTSTNAISVSAIEDSYTYSTAVKAVNDKNGKDIAATYATTSSVSSSINTAMSGMLNQVAMTLNNYVSKGANVSNVMGAGSTIDLKTNKAKLILPVYEANATDTPPEEGALYIKKGTSGNFQNTIGNGSYTNSNGYTFEYKYRVSSDGFGQIWGTVVNAATIKYKTHWLPGSFNLPFTMLDSKYVINMTNQVNNVDVAGAEFYIKTKNTTKFEFAMYNRNDSTNIVDNTVNIYICGQVS